MDSESIYRLGLEFINNIDLISSDEIYDPGTNNHIIFLKLIKDDELVCPHCGQVGNYVLRSSRTQEFRHSSFEADNLTIRLYRRIFLCDCHKTFTEPNPFGSNKRKTTIQKEMKVLNSLKILMLHFLMLLKNLSYLLLLFRRYLILTLI